MRLRRSAEGLRLLVPARVRRLLAPRIPIIDASGRSSKLAAHGNNRGTGAPPSVLRRADEDVPAAAEEEEEEEEEEEDDDDDDDDDVVENVALASPPGVADGAALPPGWGRGGSRWV